MVLSSKDIELVKLDVQFDYKLASLWETRNMTRSYIIQCLADREIQKRLRHEGYLKSKEFRHNCSVIHNPDNYSHVNQILYFILLITVKNRKTVEQVATCDGNVWYGNSNTSMSPKLRKDESQSLSQSRKRSSESGQGATIFRSQHTDVSTSTNNSIPFLLSVLVEQGNNANGRTQYNDDDGIPVWLKMVSGTILLLVLLFIDLPY